MYNIGVLINFNSGKFQRDPSALGKLMIALSSYGLPHFQITRSLDDVEPALER